MSQTTHRFAVVKHRRSKSGTCPVCGRERLRTKTFFETISQFNKNADGSVKGPLDISASLKKTADAWVPDFTCDPAKSRDCKPANG